MNRKEAIRFIEEEQKEHCRNYNSCLMCPKYNMGLISDHTCKFDELSDYIMELEDNK